MTLLTCKILDQVNLLRPRTYLFSTAPAAGKNSTKNSKTEENGSLSDLKVQEQDRIRHGCKKTRNESKNKV